MFNRRRFWLIAFIVLGALFCALRVWRMADSCLWFDEIFSVHAAEHEWGAMYWFAAQDLIHPPLFYSILKLWIAFGGASLFWLRLLPVIFACLSLVPLYFLCREMKVENRVMAFGVFLFAVNGTFIKYAQLVRMYSLLMLLSLLSIWLFARYFNRGKNLIPLIVVNLLMVYTHYFGWLVVGCEIAAVLIFQRFKWRGMAVMTGILGVLYLPWILVVYKASVAGSEIGQNIGWVSRPGLAEIGNYFIDLAEPFYFQASNAEPASFYTVSIPMLIVFAAAFTVFFMRFRDRTANEKRTIYFLSLFSFLPMLLVFAASWILPHSIWGTRHLIIASGPLMLFAATVMIKFDHGVMRTVVVAAIAAVSVYAFVLNSARSTPVYVWCAWEGIANEIGSHTPGYERVKVYTFENLVAYHVWFALRGSDRSEISAIKGVDGMHDDESYFLPRGFDDVKRAKVDDISDAKAWLLFRTEKFGQETNLLDRIKKKGYLLCPNTPARFGATDVFAVQIVRSGMDCD